MIDNSFLVSCEEGNLSRLSQGFNEANPMFLRGQSNAWIEVKQIWTVFFFYVSEKGLSDVKKL